MFIYYFKKLTYCLLKESQFKNRWYKLYIIHNKLYILQILSTAVSYFTLLSNHVDNA